MNKKMFLVLAAVLGLVAIPFVAAAPAIAQYGAQMGDVLQTQDQLHLQTKDCSCQVDALSEPLQTQSQDQLRTQDCTQQENCTCTNDGVCDGTQLRTQTRQQTCLQDQTADGQQYQYSHSFQHQNQAKGNVP